MILDQGEKKAKTKEIYIQKLNKTKRKTPTKKREKKAHRTAY